MSPKASSCVYFPGVVFEKKLAGHQLRAHACHAETPARVPTPRLDDHALKLLWLLAGLCNLQGLDILGTLALKEAGKSCKQHWPTGLGALHVSSADRISPGGLPALLCEPGFASEVPRALLHPALRSVCRCQLLRRKYDLTAKVFACTQTRILAMARTASRRSRRGGRRHNMSSTKSKKAVTHY